jgi:hypothetical protein
MSRSLLRASRMLPLALFIFLFFLAFGPPLSSQGAEPTIKPLILSARMEKRTLVYRVNGKRVEDSRENSLLTNLENVVNVRGTAIPVFIIIDVRAPFTEVGKLETALDKVELTRDRRLFVTDFSDGIMNECHWDETAIPIPRND